MCIYSYIGINYNAFTNLQCPLKTNWFPVLTIPLDITVNKYCTLDQSTEDTY